MLCARKKRRDKENDKFMTMLVEVVERRWPSMRGDTIQMYILTRLKSVDLMLAQSGNLRSLQPIVSLSRVFKHRV